jgi:hypothetical protein
MRATENLRQIRTARERRRFRAGNRRYNGRDLCQMDNRSFPQFCAGPDWKDAVKNIGMGARIAGRKRAFLAAGTLTSSQMTTSKKEKI